MSKGALVIFVKTPEFSPVKTRLAASIGAANALKFYELSLRATAAIAREAKKNLADIDVWWAVAEETALRSARWRDFPVIFQGDGNLGDRLNFVYSQLLEKYDFVAFMGADSPHVSPTVVAEALNQTKSLSQKGFVVGSTDDGGFYYFGGGLTLPRESWTDIEYSSETTADQLIQNLEKFGSIKMIEKTFDIDTIEDLKKLSTQVPTAVTEQSEIIDWANSIK